MLLLGYTYVGYPLLLLLLQPVSGDRTEPHDGGHFPSVTMVVAVHNEASIIAEKVQNCRGIQYPGEFTCLFVSDSTDGTDSVLESETDGQISLLTLPERRGKSYALNRAMEQVDSDVVIFSDANTMYEPSAVSELVAPLADDRIGCVTGKLELRTLDGTSGEGLYWQYELSLRRLEQSLGTTVSVNGGVLAIRADEFEPLPEGVLVDDLVIALRQLRRGRNVQYQESAIATERTPSGIDDEFTRRVRIGAGNYQVLWRLAGTLFPSRALPAIQFLSHKVLRWLGPWMLTSILLSSLLLALLEPSVPTFAIVGTQVIGYAFALIGMKSRVARSLPVFRIPAYFVSMNVALALGCFHSSVAPTTGFGR
ncbi:glycosyltransferase family 2 protein [Haloarculaceae archaeon H-GB2-1]|nr:glycosyltransferase family 2 protein [Haloarculaceae archaeon H-GB2-1]